MICEVHFCTVHYNLLDMSERRGQLQLRFGFVIMGKILTFGFAPAPTHQPDKENKTWSVWISSKNWVEPESSHIVILSHTSSLACFHGFLLIFSRLSD